ncbi:MAG: hypothetical protein GX801_11790 [Fibrobacter sp.]|nr:hypothetical protein [Fibrobacter sp.]
MNIELDKEPEANPEEPTIEYYDDDGQLVIKELSKEYLSKGAWQTILFKYQELNPRTGEFGEPKATIRRFQKRDGTLRQRSRFNISSAAQAKKMVEILQRWFP